MRNVCLMAGRILSLLLVTNMVYAQGVGTSGDIKGLVFDSTGAALANASVVAVETAKGIQHSTVTDETGHYHFGRTSYFLRGQHD